MSDYVGPCRYLATSKPRRDRADVSLCRCPSCGRLLIGIPLTTAPGSPASASSKDPAPAGAPAPAIVCCGQEAEVLTATPNDALPKDLRLDYQITGGLNENCVVVTWGKERPSWIYLETFRGGQYVDVEPRSYKEVLAFAGKDAYAYCDKIPCAECSFRCKHGFVIYAYLPDTGLVSLEMNRISTAKG